MQSSSSQWIQLLFTFLSTLCPSESREFCMTSGTGPDFSLVKIFSRTNWRTLMVWLWEPHLSTSHHIHIRRGLKYLQMILMIKSFLKIYRKKNSNSNPVILEPRIRERTEAGEAGSTSSWRLWPQTSTLLWTFSTHLTGSFGERIGTERSLVSSYHALCYSPAQWHDLNFKV